MEEKIKIFVSYSHENGDWVSLEGKYKLIPWLEKQLIDQADVWTDHTLKKHLGEEFTRYITDKVLEADFALLLISQDFVSSKYIMDVELPLIRQQYLEGKIKILPLLLTELTKRGKDTISWIFDLQTYPNDTKPLLSFVKEDDQWEKIKVDILDGIEIKIHEIKSQGHNVIIPTETKVKEKKEREPEKAVKAIKEIEPPVRVVPKIQMPPDLPKETQSHLVTSKKAPKFNRSILLGSSCLLILLISYFIFSGVDKRPIPPKVTAKTSLISKKELPRIKEDLTVVPQSSTEKKVVTPTNENTPPKPVQKKSDAAPKKTNQSVINLGENKYEGSVKNGKPNGVGIIYYTKQERISESDEKNTLSEPGDYLKGKWNEGVLEYGTLFNKNNEKKVTIVIGRY